MTACEPCNRESYATAQAASAAARRRTSRVGGACGPRPCPAGNGWHVAASAPAATMTTGDVAALYRVDPKTVPRWVAAGRLPAPTLTLGGHRRWDADTVLAHLDASYTPAGGTR